MDVRINGSTNLQIQNDYQKNEYRKDVLLRNVDTFKNIARKSYDKREVYESTSYFDASEAEQAVEVADKEASMIECIDTLKNAVTPEDYSALEQWGLIPDEDNPEAFVSVYERIQIELAAYCDDYDISNLNINQDKMKSVLGSEAMASALSKAKDIAKETAVLGDNVKKYILENNMQPTLENVYKAIHSGVSGSTGNMTLADDQWQQLQGQVESFFTANGIEINQANMDSAKWLIAENQPLTVENFAKLEALNNVDFSDASYMKELEQNIAYTIYFGGSGMATDVTGEAYNMEKIHEAVDTVQSAMDADVDYIIKNNRKLNIENLKQTIEQRKKEQAFGQRDAKEEQTQSSKILADARAVLTAGALFNMQKVGVSITYTEITVLVEVTNTQNRSLAEQIFMLDGYAPKAEEANLLSRTMAIMSGFPALPIGVAGSIYTSSIEYTVESVYAEGQVMASKYRMASMTYEAVGTEVRADLGDSIAKAFGNIDDLLTDVGVELNDANRRSARVLGYNSLEITVESVVAMGEITAELDAVTKNLTPRAAMHLIRNGINPLNMDIRQLNEQLININEEIGATDADEKYSEYLWKLEKNKNITQDERAAYIQLYRVINQVNGFDGRAIGAVSKANQEMTLANLYTAVKTKQAGNIDRKIDDDFGLFDGTYSEDALTRYMEQTISIMEDDSLHGEYEYERMQEKLRSISQIETMSEQEFMRFVSGMEGVSVNNIYSAMMVGDRNFYKKITDLNDEKATAATDKISDVWQEEGETSESDINGAYGELNEALALENREESYDRAIMRTDMRQAVQFMARQAESRSYYVPMEIGGEATMVHLTVKQGGQMERGRITIYTETAVSKISVLMNRTEDGYDIWAATDNEATKKKLQELCDGHIVMTEKVMDGMWNQETTVMEGTDVSYGELIRQAKSFIHNVLKKI